MVVDDLFAFPARIHVLECGVLLRRYRNDCDPAQACQIGSGFAGRDHPHFHSQRLRCQGCICSRAPHVYTCRSDILSDMPYDEIIDRFQRRQGVHARIIH